MSFDASSWFASLVKGVYSIEVLVCKFVDGLSVLICKEMKEEMKGVFLLS